MVFASASCRVIDVGSEWRTFSNDANAKDMCRVGASENFLLDGGDLSTMISGPSPSDSRQLDEHGKPMYRNRRNISAPDRVLLSAFREISQMGEHLNLPKSISVSFIPSFTISFHCILYVYLKPIWNHYVRKLYCRSIRSLGHLL